MQLEKLQDPMTYGVSGGLITYGWIGTHLNEIAIAFGMLMGLLTFIGGIYFKLKRDKREQEMHNAQMKALAQEQVLSEDS